MPSNPIHVLLITNNRPLPGTLARLFEAGEVRFTKVRDCGLVEEDTVTQGVDGVLMLQPGPEDPLAASVVTEATRLLERFGANRVGLLVMAHDAETAEMDVGNFVEIIHPDIPADELRGKLTTMARYRPIIQQIERELTNMQRLGKKLNRHFTEIDQEMRLASRLQHDFLPQELPTVGGIRFATLFRPASWVSGDIYDVFRIDEHRVGMYIADAVGHGMAAGLLTMFIKRAIVPKEIHGNQYTINSPGSVLGVLNESLKLQNLPNCQFVTACYCTYDVQTRQLDVARAGHPFPVRIGTDGNLTEIRSGGGLLGIFPDEQFETVTTTLEPGEKLLLYSDGVEIAFIESRSPSDKEPRYKSEFRSVAQLDAEELVRHLGILLDREEGSLNPQDDVTVIVLETPR